MKIKKIGASPYEVTAETKDVLVWLECIENESHPSYLNTPYNLVQGQRCPLCEGREPIVPYKIAYFAGKINKDGGFNYTFRKGHVTTLKEAKDEVNKVYKDIKRKYKTAKSECDLVIIDEIPDVKNGKCEIKPHEDGTLLVGRMEGTFDGGEFFIDILTKTN